MSDEAEKARFETTKRYQTLYTAKKKIFEGKRKRKLEKEAAPPIAEPPVRPLVEAAAKLDERASSAVASVSLVAPPVVARPPAGPPIVAPPMFPAPPAYAAPAPFAPPAFAPPQVVSVPAPVPGPPPSTIPAAALEALLTQPQASPHAPPARVGAQTVPLDGGRTMAVDIHELLAKMNPGTPFKVDASAPPPEPRPVSASTDATPFRANVPAQAPPVNMPPATPPSPVLPAPAARADKLGATMIGIDAEALLKQAFPFAAGAASKTAPVEPRPPNLPPAMPFDQRARPPTDAPPAAGGRPESSPPPESVRSTSPLPFKQAAFAPHAASNKIFNMNQFASLTAEIAERPETVAEIRKRYGITEAQHRAESERWTQEFAANAELRDRYFGSVQRYRDYLKNRTG